MYYTAYDTLHLKGVCTLHGVVMAVGVQYSGVQLEKDKWGSRPKLP